MRLVGAAVVVGFLPRSMRPLSSVSDQYADFSFDSKSGP